LTSRPSVADKLKNVRGMFIEHVSSAGIRHIQSAACEPVVQALSARNTLMTRWRAVANTCSQHTPYVLITHHTVKTLSTDLAQNDKRFDLGLTDIVL